MKVTIEDDDGKQVTLETNLAVIPPGYVVLICPRDKDGYIGPKHCTELEERLNAEGIRALVVPIPICVWSVADAPA